MNFPIRGAAMILAGLVLVLPATAQTYTQEQADRGHVIYTQKCSTCHGASLEGVAGPSLSGPEFRAAWSDESTTVDDLHFIISSSMPPRGQPKLTDDQYIDVLAFILRENGVPAGAEPLMPDSEYLAAIRMTGAGDMPLTDAPAFVEGPRGLEPTGTGPSRQQLLDAVNDASNWLYHTHDFHGTRYSALDQITKENVSQLRPECIYQVGDAGQFQNGPIVYDGVMYVSGVHVTAAFDAATCRPVWRHEWTPLASEVWLNNRGVAIQDGYVVRGTSDGYLFALDAADGTLLWARRVADSDLGETFTMAPMIYGDTILIGPAGSENAISGWIGAFRLSDGEEVWRFHTVPGATLEGGHTWGNPEGIVIGGGATWTPLSLDTERGELYVPVTNPAPDIPAELRPGDNLYTNSIVALDVRSGDLRWYEQMVPNDYHDWDLTQVSPIFRGTVDGVERDLVTVTGKHGLLHMLDRTTQERLYEAEVARRENVDAPVVETGTYACPGFLGGVEWNGPALHPGEGLLVTPAVNYCMTIFPAEEVRHVEGELYLGGRVEYSQEGWSGYLTATNVADGSQRWRYVSEAPMIAAVTTTAGDLVLTGDLSGDFLALDVASGEPLYRFNTGGPMGGGVVSYAVDGRQYIAVASGFPSGFWVSDHNGQATVVVFALPR